MSVSRNSSFKRHQLRKHNIVEYRCDLCGCIFRTEHDIEQHMKRKHLIRSVECNNEIGNQTAQDVNDNDSSPITFTTNGETRVRPYSLKVHILSVENLPPNFCDVTTTQLPMKLHRVDRHQSDISQHESCRMSFRQLVPSTSKVLLTGLFYCSISTFCCSLLIFT